MFSRKWEVRPYVVPTGFVAVTLTWANWAGAMSTASWQFAVSGNSGATGFGWKLRIAAAPGSDLHLALRAALDGQMPPEILADRLEDEDQEKYGIAARWLRDGALKAVA